jgi:predicted secreted acid phosphatase
MYRWILLALMLVPLISEAKINHHLKSYPENQRLREYYQSGKYFRDLELALNEAKAYLQRQCALPRMNRMAIVLDIDETALSNYHDLERLYFTRNTQALTGAYMLAGAEALAPVLDLYNEAKENGISVFFISERPNTPEIMTVTVNNLRHAGFDKWQDIILKPIDNDETIQEFKTKARKLIVSQGYDILLNIGDQQMDLQGGFAEVRVKVPNPFYEIS